MTIPYRGTTGDGTYFVTASTWEKNNLLQSERMARLLMDVLSHYQSQIKYRLHEFVVMPNHFHALFDAAFSGDPRKSVQFIRGGFSFRVKKELGLTGEIWQTSFYDRRVRDEEEYSRFRHYIHMNPVRRGLVPSPEEFHYSSATLKLDESPSVAKARRLGCL
jgi:putative transposase